MVIKLWLGGIILGLSFGVSTMKATLLSADVIINKMWNGLSVNDDCLLFFIPWHFWTTSVPASTIYSFIWQSSILVAPA